MRGRYARFLGLAAAIVLVLCASDSCRRGGWPATRGVIAMAAGCAISLVSAALAGWLLVASAAETPEARMQRGVSGDGRQAGGRRRRWGWPRRSAESWRGSRCCSGSATAYVALLPLEVRLAIASMTVRSTRLHDAQLASRPRPREPARAHRSASADRAAGAPRPADAERQDHDVLRSDRDDHARRAAADRAGADARQAPPRQERRRRDGADRRRQRARGDLRVPAQGSRRAGAARAHRSLHQVHLERLLLRADGEHPRPAADSGGLATCSARTSAAPRPATSG